jgi:hypothetical protein
MLLPHGNQPRTGRYMGRERAYTLSESSRSLGEVSHGKPKPKMEKKTVLECAACAAGKHYACFSSRCLCGQKEGHL